ncbi:colony stimulating factor 3 (granulocyte) b [Danio aesculapii]|uniref:colony stimulating factor 3 (granulocyte) b n=1 Tax=Danio aesculapii TaxID=1142201 RepID=UPI0024C0272C|nr:colony stimulating factor 3 (granulocyte) b [Danio aesculapii]
MEVSPVEQSGPLKASRSAQQHPTPDTEHRRAAMKTCCLFLLHLCVCQLLCVPLQPELTHTHGTQPELTHTHAEHTLKALSLAKKILSDIPAVQELCAPNTGLSSSTDDKHLEFLSSEFQIPMVPLLKSEALTQEERVQRMLIGLELHHRVLRKLLEPCSPMNLLNDLTELRALLLLQVPPAGPEVFPHTHTLSAPLSQFQLQVCVRVTLRQLRSFMQDVFRSLRHISVSRR